MNLFTYIILLGILWIPCSLIGQHSSQWRGPDRNGIYPDTALLHSWPEEGPELLWYSEEIGNGHSSASVTTDRVYITGREYNTEYLTCFDLSGKLLWKAPFGRRWQGSFPESRSTPNVIGDHVYVVSGMAEVVCLDAQTGEKIWKVDAREEFQGYSTMWGFCESPLIVEDRVIFTPGGGETHMVALDRYTGEAVWTSPTLNDSVGYVSPMAFDHHGRRIITSIGANYFFGVDASDGTVLWKFNYKPYTTGDHWYAPIINVNTPLYRDGEIFISKGYDHVALKFALSEDGTQLEELWADTTLDVHLGGMVLHEGYIYGSNWLHNRDGNWCCVDWTTGEIMYETHWENKGSVIFADGYLVVYEEKRGHVALVEPTPDEFRIISSFKTEYGSGPAWAHPVISDGILYVRRGRALMVYDIGAQSG